MVKIAKLCWRRGRTCDGYYVHPHDVDIAGLARDLVFLNATFNVREQHAGGQGVGCTRPTRVERGEAAGRDGRDGSGRGGAGTSKVDNGLSLHSVEVYL